MAKKEFLTEENYERGKKKIKSIALIILIVGIILGGSLIVIGIIKQSKVNSGYSEESKASVQEKLKAELETERTKSLETEKKNLEAKKAELEAKIKPTEDQIKSLEREPFKGFDDAYYARKDKIEELEKSIQADKESISIIEKALDQTFDHCAFDAQQNNTYTSKYCSIVNNTDDNLKDISIIEKTLDESFDWCEFDEAKNNKQTSKYCSYKQQLENFTSFNKSFSAAKYIPFYMIGGFIIVASCMIAGVIYIFAKRREIMAFTTQQTMPVTQEVIDKMAPTVGNAAGTIGKSLAQGITSGIKEGLNSQQPENSETSENKEI